MTARQQLIHTFKLHGAAHRGQDGGGVEWFCVKHGLHEIVSKAYVDLNTLGWSSKLITSVEDCPALHCQFEVVTGQRWREVQSKIATGKTMTAITIPKPRLQSVPLAEGLRWRGGGEFMYQEKSDGIHCFWTGPANGGSPPVFNGEEMRDGSIVLNDLVSLHGHDMTRETTKVRWNNLVEWFRPLAFPFPIRLSETGSGAEFLEHIISRGGEGIVCKPWDAPFGVNWLKCKRCETFDLIVTEIDYARGSLHLADPLTSTDRGWCPAKADHLNVRIGDVVEVAAFGLTAKGKLREPRFQRLRFDKLYANTNNN